jgi:2-keto-4-pentenoate hydratase/2-oxohepta-3-ene-1,7-dioic acid hydratase in catechol pathway
MKLAVDARHGVVAVTADTVVEIHDALGIPARHPDPLLYLVDHVRLDDLLGRLNTEGLPRHPLGEALLLPPLAQPPKIIAAPVNYLDHKAEMNEQQSIADFGLFLKANSSVIGPGGTVELPYADKRVDQEGELGVVIGRTARSVAPEDALDHVFGYTCVLDISLRSTEDRSTRKSFDTFTPVGPWITTADEIPDPGRLELQCWVDDELRQHVSTGELIFDVPLLVSYASSVMTLQPGDIIATGTPAGVGPINDAAQIRLDIEGIGELGVRVDASGAVPYAERPRPVHPRHPADA